MTQIQILPPAAKFLKKLKDKKLKSLYKEAIEDVYKRQAMRRVCGIFLMPLADFEQLRIS